MHVLSNVFSFAPSSFSSIFSPFLFLRLFLTICLENPVILVGYLEKYDDKDGAVHEDDNEVEFEEHHGQRTLFYEPNRLLIDRTHEFKVVHKSTHFII